MYYDIFGGPCVSCQLHDLYWHSGHETEKRRSYSERIRQLERGTFTHLVFSSAGGFGNECHKLIKLESLAKTGETKTGEEYSSVIRTEISFSLLRSATTAMRGSRNVRGFL